MALGIKDRNQIDAAITNHGRILHDATIISVNAGTDKAPEVGQINWQDPGASSLSEMLTSISEAFGGGLIDNQIATAFLTGIVSETNRFGNTKTSPKVMTMSAQLMAAGANQQLIASKLEQAAPASSAPTPQPKPAQKEEDGTLEIRHEVEAKLKESEKRKAEAGKAESDEIHIDEQGNLKAAGELIKPLEPEHKDEEPPDDGPKTPLEATAAPEVEESEAPPPEDPADKSDESEMPGSHALLNPAAKHPFIESPLTANTQPTWQDPYDSVPIDPLSGDGPGKEQIFEHKKVVQPLSEQPAPTGESNASTPSGSVNQARSAVENALATAPFNPAFQPEERQGSNPLGDELHQAAPAQPQTSSGTPSLPLPGSPAENTVPTPSDSPVEGSAPPPLPPPLMPTPGIVIPNPATPQN
jgi:hypothetical protein